MGFAESRLSHYQKGLAITGSFAVNHQMNLQLSWPYYFL